MKEPLSRINKVFENRIRLAIMSLLMVNDEMDFNQLKEVLQVTDGNLSSHVSTLEKNNYIQVNKMFEGKKPKTTYAATNEGKIAFQEHLDALEAILKGGE